jgi:antitoxin YefM
MYILKAILMYNFAMLKIMSITEARQQFLDLPEQVEDDPVIVTRHGKPVMAALNYEQFESLLETLEILSDQDFMKQIRQGIIEAEAGQTVSLEVARQKLGL